MEPQLCNVRAHHTRARTPTEGRREEKAREGLYLAQQSRTKGQKSKHFITCDGFSGYEARRL